MHGEWMEAIGNNSRFIYTQVATYVDRHSARVHIHRSCADTSLVRDDTLPMIVWFFFVDT